MSVLACVEQYEGMVVPAAAAGVARGGGAADCLRVKCSVSDRIRRYVGTSTKEKLRFMQNRYSERASYKQKK